MTCLVTEATVYYLLRSCNAFHSEVKKNSHLAKSSHFHASFQPVSARYAMTNVTMKNSLVTLITDNVDSHL